MSLMICCWFVWHVKHLCDKSPVEEVQDTAAQVNKKQQQQQQRNSL